MEASSSSLPRTASVPAPYFFVEQVHREDWWRVKKEAPWELSKGIYATIDSGELSEDTTLTLDRTPTVFELLEVARGGLCSFTDHRPHVLLEARLNGTAKRWKAALLYRTLVDKEVWHSRSSLCKRVAPGRSSRELGYDIVYSYCKDEIRWGSPAGFGAGLRRWTLQPATHTVTMQAFLPGTDIAFETETMTIDLSCTPTDE